MANKADVVASHSTLGAPGAANAHDTNHMQTGAQTLDALKGPADASNSIKSGHAQKESGEYISVIS